MNKKYYFRFLSLFMFFVLPLKLVSAEPEVKINYINPNGYPTIQCEFTTKDANGLFLKDEDFSTGDVTATEDGVPLDGTLYCPPPLQSKFSTILVIDKSASMLEPSSTPGKTRMDIAKNAAQNWIHELPPGRFECAIMCFSSTVYALQDFTDDKDSLNESLQDDILANPAGGTDYNSAFLYDDFDVDGSVPPWNHDGALRLGTSAKYPLYILFLTDGEHLMSAGERFDIWVDEILKARDSIDATIYTVTMMDRDNITSVETEYALYDLSEEVYWNMTSESELVLTFKTILEQVKTEAPPPPCIYEWEANCESGGLVELTVDNARVNASASKSYTIPDAVKPKMAYDPVQANDEPFLNIDEGVTATKQLGILAEQNYIVHGGKPNLSDNVNFDISTPAGTLQNDGTTQPVTISFTAPAEKRCYPLTITFDNSACSNKTYETSAGWIYARDIDIGSGVMHETKEYTTRSFCNKTCKSINVTKFEITGADKDYFAMVAPLPTGTLASGDCVDITFEFTPDEHRDFEANLNVSVAGYGTPFTSNITGSGSGTPQIGSVDAVTIAQHSNCSTPEVDSIIAIPSIGALDLEISDIYMDPGTNFSVTKDLIGTPIAPSEFGNVTVTLTAGQAGTYTEDLVIVSNSDTDSEYRIPITATMDSIYFASSVNTFDLVLCPGEVHNETITLSVPGADGSFGVDASIEGDMELTFLDNTHLDMAPPASQDIIVNISKAAEGTYTGKLILTDDICNRQVEIPLNLMVEAPKISYTAETFEATIPGTDTKTIRISNTSSRELTISQSTFSDPQFTFGTGVPDPIVIPADPGYVDIEIVYTPTDTSKETAYLIFEGSPCSFLDSVSLYRDPTLANITLDMGDYSGLIGQQIDMELWIRNAVNFANSEVNSMDVTLSFNPTILEPVARVKTGGTINYSNGDLVMNAIPVVQTNSDQLIETVRFLVLDNPDAGQTDIEINDPMNNDGNVTFQQPNFGTFTINFASADIKIGNITASAGETIKLPVTISNIQNFDNNFHKNLNIDLRFDKTVLSCDDASLKNCSNIDGDYRVMTIPIPVSALTSDPAVISKSFMGMLGRVESTPLEIDSVYFDQGAITANETDGLFTLNICPAGGGRLFDPDGKATSIQIVPNPANGQSIINYHIIEPGNVEIYITDIMGGNAGTLLKSEMQPGSYTMNFDAGELMAGTYILHMRTPTQSISKKVTIVK